MNGVLKIKERIILFISIISGLKFDGEYIFYYLLNNGYEVVQSKREVKDKSFTCLISDTGQFYSIEIYETAGKHPNKVTIYDSLKLLNFGVDKIAKSFDLPISKLKLDYDTYRPVGHELTAHEVEYIKNDVRIMSMALDIMFKENLNKMTIASNALFNYKKSISDFNLYFPKLTYEVDKSIRKSYKGGFTYLNPIYKEKEVNTDIIVMDSNSMHPSHMMNDYMPIGEPLYFSGKYEKDPLYPLYVQRFSCSFKLKKGKIPSIQLKHTPGYLPTEYLETTNGKIVTLTLTSVDLELFYMQYDVSDEVWFDGFKFKQLAGLFSNYINYWINKKIEAKKEDNKALYTIAKLMLNSLYGRFGLGTTVQSKYPTIENDKIKYKLYPEEIREGVYCPVASFITSYSRYDIITTSQAVRDYSLKTYGKDYYIYSDTDSVHMIKLSDEELAKIIKMDDYKLGYYKRESEAIKGIYIRQKCYLEIEYINENKYKELNEEDRKKWDKVKHNGKTIYTRFNTTIAGLPKKLGKYITVDNFKRGFKILASEEDKEHKLAFKHVKGGVLLVDTDFTIK